MKTWLTDMRGNTRGRGMKSIQTELPDKLAEALDMMIQQG
jgi:hypothetical protein